MARNTTRQGANFELDVMKDLESRGYTCLRSSGSRGAVDVVAVPARYPSDLIFIQCKITNPVIPPVEREAIGWVSYRARALPVVAYRGQDPDNARRKKILYRELTGPGPKEWRNWIPPEPIKRDDHDGVD